MLLAALPTRPKERVHAGFAIHLGSAMILRLAVEGARSREPGGEPCGVLAPDTEGSDRELSRPVFWAANILCYGFGEEVGWRGFALPRIQDRRTALTSALLVSGAWAAWHLPLFAFSAGMSSMGMAGVAGWLFSLVTGSILMTWLFNRSKGSVLAVALFHGVLDIVMTSPVKGPLPSVMGAIITLWGLAIPITLGREDLSRSPRVRDSPTRRSAPSR